MKTPPYKIMHLVSTLRIGGLERMVVDLCRGLDRERYEPVVCTLEMGGLAEPLREAGIRVLHPGQRRRGLNWRLGPVLASMIRRERVALLHSHNKPVHLPAVLAARLARVPLVHTRHGRNIPQHKALPRRLTLLRRALYLFTDMTVAVSEDARMVAREIDRVPANRLRLINNGIDTDLYRPADTPSPPAGARVSYSIPSPPGGARTSHSIPSPPGEGPVSYSVPPPSGGGPVSSSFPSPLGGEGKGEGNQIIGSVGRLSLEKDYGTLLRAFDELRRDHPGVSLVLVGDGPKRADLEAEARTLGLADRVVFLGERSDIPALLRGFDVFALSSSTEGISLTLLEAMATALPVVATRVGGNPEVVEEGATGLLVPARNPHELANALRRLLDDRNMAERMGVAGRLRVERRFSLTRMAREYESVYDRLLS